MITEKQINYIAVLAKKAGKTVGDVVFDFSGMPGCNVRSLTRGEASYIIDSLLKA